MDNQDLIFLKLTPYKERHLTCFKLNSSCKDLLINISLPPRSSRGRKD